MLSSHENGKMTEAKCESNECTPAKRRKVSDELYFNCYNNFDIHATMIADTSRTMTYKRALLTNYPRLFKSLVADVGCGTGILSVFAAQAGARRVFAIEGSDFAEVASELARKNDLVDRIEVLNQLAEDVSLPEKVDAIVSEWMGYGLLYENMLSSVIDFRDKHLKKDGLMFPQEARVFMAALGDIYGEAPAQEIGDLWQRMGNLYKVQLDTVLTSRCVSQFAERAHVEQVAPQALISEPCQLFNLDLRTVTKDELSPIQRPFKLVSFGDSKLLGFVLWFDVEFPGGLRLSTSPESEPTHWEQVVFFLKEPTDVAQDSIIEGEIQFRQASDFHRFLDINLKATCKSPAERHASASFEQTFKFREH